jgi:hypothetical protein
VWPLYHAALRARLRAAVRLFVLTADARVAVWARSTIDTGHPGGPFTPLVLGPDNLPLLDSLRVSQYHDLVLGALPEEQRRAVEAAMARAPDPHYVSEFSRRMTQKWLEGKAEAVLKFLHARGLRVPAQERARLLGCDDPATLDAWIVAAATAGSVADVLAATPRRRAPARTPRTRRARGNSSGRRRRAS